MVEKAELTVPLVEDSLPPKLWPFSRALARAGVSSQIRSEAFSEATHKLMCRGLGREERGPDNIVK